MIIYSDCLTWPLPENIYLTIKLYSHWLTWPFPQIICLAIHSDCLIWPLHQNICLRHQKAVVPSILCLRQGKKKISRGKYVTCLQFANTADFWCNKITLSIISHHKLQPYITYTKRWWSNNPHSSKIKKKYMTKVLCSHCGGITASVEQSCYCQCRAVLLLPV